MASLEQYLSWFLQNLKILRKKEFWVAFLSFIGVYGFINYVFAFISRTVLITVNMLIFVMGLIIPTLIFALDSWQKRKKVKSLPLPPPPPP